MEPAAWKLRLNLKPGYAGLDLRRNTMVRALALLASVIALALLGQSSRAVAHPVPAVWSQQHVISAHAVGGHEADDCGSHNCACCCQATCSPTSAFAPAGVSLPGNQRGSTGCDLSDCRLSPLSLKRDPPIPRLPV